MTRPLHVVLMGGWASGTSRPWSSLTSLSPVVSVWVNRGGDQTWPSLIEESSWSRGWILLMWTCSLASFLTLTLVALITFYTIHGLVHWGSNLWWVGLSTSTFCPSTSEAAVRVPLWYELCCCVADSLIFASTHSLNSNIFLCNLSLYSKGFLISGKLQFGMNRDGGLWMNVWW